MCNLSSPDRNEVRHDNFQRRQQQMTSQGFRCAQHTPYRGIGDPFHLDHKRLILNALGQLPEVLLQCSLQRYLLRRPKYI